jgi:hypothetical protein
MKQFNCLNCGKLKNISRNSYNKYCSVKCHQDLVFKKKFKLFLKNKLNVFIHHSATRRALIYRDGNKCSVCNIKKWKNKPIVFEIEHKDGNSSNHRASNLCLICPNCHSQTSTYKGRNKGYGREARRLKYQERKLKQHR